MGKKAENAREGIDMIICDQCFGDGYVCNENDPANATAEECPKCKGAGQIKGEYSDSDDAE